MGAKTTTPAEGRTENDTVAELARTAALAERRAEVIEHDGRSFLIVPEGFQIAEELTPDNAIADKAPTRIKQGVTIQTLDSLGEYIQRFKGENTVLFGDVASNAIIAVIDYHGQDKADFGGHRATLTLPFSYEWQTWKAIDGKLMEQGKFARFLEENGADIAAPNGADLLEICKDLQANRSVNFTKAVRTATDIENFEWSDHTDVRTRNGGIELPTKFLLRIPVYFGDAPTELYAFLRYSLDDGKLLLGIELNRAETVRQAQFQQHVLTVSDRTDRLAVFGRPGS